ncbi:hypothetical protein [Streptomyces lavenduligriseus]|uniref:Mce-associated membrane protein n=1 Tax=Streptomyces lavenduligriseus TaxID=67315 RepID=A0ABT0P7C2_9ACTN|nr:hypothetical protein [Streptomyces lavenduligriseus]MCL3998902.1 hypothetical protein [Streptomyces lavenduligriseus]
MPETDDTRARRGTIALFAASAVLAVVGAALLLGTGGSERPATSALVPTTATSSLGAPGRGSPARHVPSPAPAAASSSSAPSVMPAEPRPVPQAVQDAARAFVVTWASHDARPGKDTSYDDASRRAADHAAGDLAQDLRTRTSGSAGAQQWRRWKSGRVQVTASVQRVSLPDGAPAPTQDSGFARVLYTVTQKPAAGAPTKSEQHVALKLRRGGDGIWRVVGLPDV